MLTLANNHITSVSREPHRTIINATVDVADEGWGDLLTALHVAWNGWTLKITKVTEIQRDEVRAANRALSTSRRVQIEAEARLGVEKSAVYYAMTITEDGIQELTKLPSPR